ncbi:hypothetical protein H5410_051918 [Solanum commersonii]|uniref:Uncharacterized protein n=1 Tax=Solanum commersonii TaxID=4109 RepID=A0A9J5WZS3_SOLCO|nr:hypothetical protein H5410_051918 [Solanum commersonii]
MYVCYERNKVPFDLYDLEEENYPNIGEILWREPTKDIGPSNTSPVLTLDDTTMETLEEEDDYADTDWDWMEADD